MDFRSKRRALGQNFLVDRDARERIVAAMQLRSGDPVLEIGPGRGALTELLIGRSGAIAAVELDRDLCSLLRERFSDDRLLLFEQNVLRLELSAVVRALGRPDDSRLILAGNLPYAISKPIAQKLIRERRHVGRAVLMFQREVAERLTAEPGSRVYGPLGILAGRAFEIRPLFDLPPDAFRPRPKVASRVTVWRPRYEPVMSDELEADLRSCLAACFAQRRRTLRNNLRRALPDDRSVDELLAAAELRGTVRAEAVSPAAFVRMASAWRRLRA